MPPMPLRRAWGKVALIAVERAHHKWMVVERTLQLPLVLSLSKENRRNVIYFAGRAFRGTIRILRSRAGVRYCFAAAWSMAGVTARSRRKRAARRIM